MAGLEKSGRVNGGDLDGSVVHPPTTGLPHTQGATIGLWMRGEFSIFRWRGAYPNSTLLGKLSSLIMFTIRSLRPISSTRNLAESEAIKRLFVSAVTGMAKLH